ncbi:MAG: methyl-accepting chemotaxis protein [Thauera sp.]
MVANEVRTLAGRSADAAKEIKELINTSVERVKTGNGLVDQAGDSATQLLTAVESVTGVMTDISTASTNQLADVVQLREAVAGIDQATQMNSALVEQMAAAVSSLQDLSRNQVEAVALFKLPEVADQADAPDLFPEDATLSN